METKPVETTTSQAAKWIIGGVIAVAAACGLLGTCLFVVLIATGALTGG